MAKLIDASKANIQDIACGYGCTTDLYRVEAWFNALPAVDAVEVVRCKDCKHFIQEEHGCNHFGYYSHTPWVDEVDFCSYGERRNEE